MAIEPNLHLGGPADSALPLAPRRSDAAIERMSRSRWMAAVLAAGPGALLSHRSAAALWGLRGQTRARIDVMVRGSTGRLRGALDIHDGNGLIACDATERDAIPCTTLARTLLDLAAVVDRRSLERAIDAAEEQREFDLTEVDRLLVRSRGRRGVRRLAAALEAYAGPTTTRSEAEERLLRLIEAAGLARPRVNDWIPLENGTGYRPDFLWPERRLIVEVDGRSHHARRAAFRHDRRRDRRLALAGYETRRYDAGELFESGGARVIAELRAFLEPRP